MSLYEKRGVSAQKEEVHAATKNLDQGLFPKAFCKVYSDVLCGDDQWVNVMHADGAGTKSILAYLYWKETGDVSVWKGIAQDAIVMNLDDLLCTGIHNNILFSSTIDRNKKLIPGDVLETIINGTQEFFDQQVVYLGKYHMTDDIEVTYPSSIIQTDVGHLLLSPTRTYAPVLKVLLDEHFENIHGLIHCSGGG